MVLKRLSELCLNCEHKDNCDKKRMEACGVLEYEPIQQPYTEPIAQPLQQEYLVKHDYRDVKIAENTTVTIDLEELKRKAVEDFYKSIHGDFLQGGA